MGLIATLSNNDTLGIVMLIVAFFIAMLNAISMNVIAPASTAVRSESW
jgi:hypothetical protein